MPFSLYGNELLCFPTEEKLVGEVHVQLQSHPAHSAHALQPELALLLLLPDILHPLICHRHVFSEISKTFNCRFVPMFLYWLLLMMMPALLFKAHLLGEGELKPPKKYAYHPVPFVEN